MTKWQRDAMTLDSIQRGKRAQIIAVNWEALAPDEGKRLRALGLDAGARVAIAHKGIFGTSDPIAVMIGRMTIAVRKVHAQAMEVVAL